MRVKFSRALFLSVALMMLVVMAAGTLLAQQLLKDSVQKATEQTLHQAAEYFVQQIGLRAGELVAAVDVAAADFGFREALASQDMATIQSAVQNQAARIGASHASVRLSDGRIVNSGATALITLAGVRPDTQGPVGISAFDGKPYLIISTPVDAPLPSGELQVAFVLDQEFIDQFYHLTGSDVSIHTAAGRGQPALLSSLYLPEQRLARENIGTALLALLEGESTLHYIGDIKMMSLLVPLSASNDVRMYVHRSLNDDATILNALARDFLGLVAAAVLLALAFTSFLSSRLTQPLKSFGKIATGISRGDYRSTLPEQTFSELAELASAFTGMQTALSERESRIAHQARHDPLTGLQNRVAALECIRNATGDTRQSASCTVLAIDIHQLRSINDSYGQEGGDSVLIWMASALTKACPRGAQAFRMASDDFLIVIPDAREDDGARVATLIGKHQGHPITLDNNISIGLRFHMGMAHSPQHGVDAEKLIHHAERALYRAREKHTSLEIHNPEEEVSRKRRLTLLSDLRIAIERDEIAMDYLPQTDRTRPLEVTGGVRLRWEHHLHGDIRGSELTTLIQTSGMSTTFNSWMLQQSCKVVANWLQRRIPASISMEILGDDIHDSSFVGRVLETSQRYGIHRSSLRMEISETLIASDPILARELIGRLRRQQIKVTVTRFGTGHGSFSLFRDIDIDEIRIDRSFAANAGRSKTDTAIVANMISLGHQLGIRVCADGVDSRESLALLEQMGIDGVQGMVLGRAMSQSQFESWCEAWISSKRRNQS